MAAPVRVGANAPPAAAPSLQPATLRSPSTDSPPAAAWDAALSPNTQNTRTSTTQRNIFSGASTGISSPKTLLMLPAAAAAATAEDAERLWQLLRIALGLGPRPASEADLQALTRLLTELVADEEGLIDGHALAQAVPADLAPRLAPFFAESESLGHGAGVTVSELMVTLVLGMPHHSLDRSVMLRFVFRLLDVDDTGVISAAAMATFLSHACLGCGLDLDEDMIDVLAASLAKEARELTGSGSPTTSADNSRGSIPAINMAGFTALFREHVELANIITVFSRTKDASVSPEDLKPELGPLYDPEDDIDSVSIAGQDPVTPPTATTTNATASVEGNLPAPTPPPTLSAKNPTSSTGGATRLERLRDFNTRYPNACLWLVVFFAINAGLFAWQFIHWHHNNDATRLFGECLPVARGSAAALSFNCFLVLWPVIRPLVTVLQDTRLSFIMPFDCPLSVHKLAAGGIVFFTITHVAAHICDIKRLLHADSGEVVAAVFGAHLFNNQVPSMTQVLRLRPVFTGLTMVAILILVLPLAAPAVRRSHFRLFWMSHHLLLVFLVLTMVHGTAMLLGMFPKAPFAIGVPLLLYLAARVARRLLPRHQSVIISAEQKPGNVLALYMRRPQNWRPPLAGQYVFLRVPTVSGLEWHPFTLTSAPSDPFVSCHIRAVGPWTSKLMRTCEAINRTNTRALFRMTSTSAALCARLSMLPPSPRPSALTFALALDIESEVEDARTTNSSSEEAAEKQQTQKQQQQTLAPGSHRPSVSRPRASSSVYETGLLRLPSPAGTPRSSFSGYLKVQEFELAHSRPLALLQQDDAAACGGWCGDAVDGNPASAHRGSAAACIIGSSARRRDHRRATVTFEPRLSGAAESSDAPKLRSVSGLWASQTPPYPRRSRVSSFFPALDGSQDGKPGADGPISGQIFDLPGLQAFPNLQLSFAQGSPSQEYQQYRTMVLVGGGIGVTPMASILRDLVQTRLWRRTSVNQSPPLIHEPDSTSAAALAKHYSSAVGPSGASLGGWLLGRLRQRRPPVPVDKVYFHWVNRGRANFSWFSEMTAEIAGLDTEGLIELNHHVTGIKPATPMPEDSGAASVAVTKKALTEALLSLARRLALKHDSLCVVSGLTTNTLTRFGRPNWAVELARIKAETLAQRKAEELQDPAAASPADGGGGGGGGSAIKIGVFFCGPPALGQSVKAACLRESDSRVQFVFRQEVF